MCIKSCRVFIWSLQFLLIIRLFAKSCFIYGDFSLYLYFFIFLSMKLFCWSPIGLPPSTFCSFGYACTTHSFIILFCVSVTHILNLSITIAASGIGSVQLDTRLRYDTFFFSPTFLHAIFRLLCESPFQMTLCIYISRSISGGDGVSGG